MSAWRFITSHFGGKLRVICYVEKEREWKTRSFMNAFADGARQRDTAVVVNGYEVKRNADLHVLWGHRWFSEKAVPQISEAHENYAVIDNGWFNPANGGQTGYFRFMLNGPETPVLKGMPADRAERLNVRLSPWQKKRGDKILICMPGPHFGLPWGIKVLEWERDIVDEVRKHTDREIIVRRKGSTTQFGEDLSKAHALVTHSSSAAVTAAMAGIPVFCERMCAAFPVRSGELVDLERPTFPERLEWLYSLTYQQWNMGEFKVGKAWNQIKGMLK